MNYKIISSCSTGNATIIRDIILIDCGVTFKKLKKYYKQLKIVLLTHVHQDHFNRSTIKRLAQERPTLRFACCEWLLQPLLECGVERRNIDILQIGTKYDYKVIYMTDTKTVEGISAKNYDLYLVEGNYDEDEIEERIKEKQQDCKYVYEFRAKDSHLSKQQASEFLLNNMGENSKYVFMHQHVER